MPIVRTVSQDPRGGSPTPPLLQAPLPGLSLLLGLGDTHNQGRLQAHSPPAITPPKGQAEEAAGRDLELRVPLPSPRTPLNTPLGAELGAGGLTWWQCGRERQGRWVAESTGGTLGPSPRGGTVGGSGGGGAGVLGEELERAFLCKCDTSFRTLLLCCPQATAGTHRPWDGGPQGDRWARTFFQTPRAMVPWPGPSPTLTPHSALGHLPGSDSGTPPPPHA